MPEAASIADIDLVAPFWADIDIPASTAGTPTLNNANPGLYFLEITKEQALQNTELAALLT